MVKQHSISCNLNTKNAFVVYLLDKIVKCTKTGQELYICKPKIKKNRKVNHKFLNTVEKTKDKIERTKQKQQDLNLQMQMTKTFTL